MLNRLLQGRETSPRENLRLPAAVHRERNQTLDLSVSRIFLCENAFNGHGVSAMALDPVEGRYLLAGSVDGTLCAFDVLSHYYRPKEESQHHHDHLFRLLPRPERTGLEVGDGHRGGAICLQWYPVDSGLFLSAFKDNSVRLFDANELRAVCKTEVECEINCAAMPEMASGHCLVAIAAKHPVIRLWDPRSDCIALNFVGHIGKEVTALTWSSSSEWLLISGGSGGQIRFWDVRKANSLLALDQYNTKRYSETLKPLPDLEHLKRKRLHTPQSAEEILYNAGKFNRNLQEWVNTKNLVKKLSDSRKNDTATAHDSAVALLKTSEDGLHLYSAASAMTEMRKWDLTSGKNMLVHFECPASGLRCEASGGALDETGSLFVPHKNAVYHLDSQTGKRVRKMNGHYDRVTACTYNKQFGEMYTSGLDGNILLWEPETLKSHGLVRGETKGQVHDRNVVGEDNEDDWTTDEEI